MNKAKILRKGGLLALGLASITTKTADKLIREFVRKGKLSRKQGEVLARKVIAETLREQQKIKKQVLGEVAKSARRVISVTHQEAKRLAKKMPKAKPKKKAKKRKKARKKKRRR